MFIGIGIDCVFIYGDSNKIDWVERERERERSFEYVKMRLNWILIEQLSIIFATNL